MIRLVFFLQTQFLVDNIYTIAYLSKYFNSMPSEDTICHLSGMTPD